MEKTSATACRTGPAGMEKHISAFLVSILALLALVLRCSLDIDGATDVDTVNFGLAAFRFDLLDHQPHPPGYPGYVLVLKVIHLLAPGLSPVDVAKWGSRLCSVATVPAAFWATGVLMGGGQRVPGARILSAPVAAAALAVFNPVLWYYGGDGQSHAAEGLATILIFGAAAAVRGRPGSWRILLLAASVALSGALRPTIVLFCLPALVWVLWGRPARDWALALVAGCSGLAAWLVPLVIASGGWELYQRAGRALMGMLFDSYCVVGARATGPRILSNLSAALWGGAFAAVPFLLWSRAEPRPWRRPLLAMALLCFVFHALVYTAEPGYFASIAALSCLVPATWPGRLCPLLKLRAALVLAASCWLILLGPATVPGIGAGAVFTPSLAHALEVEAGQKAYRDVVAAAAEGQPALVLSDNPSTTIPRLLPTMLPKLQFGLYLRKNPIQPRWDNWLFFGARTADAVPAPVPLEPGPPAEHALRSPVSRVIIGPDSSDAFRSRVRRAAACAPRVVTHRKVRMEVYRAGCLPRLTLGDNVIRIPAAPEVRSLPKR